MVRLKIGMAGIAKLGELYIDAYRAFYFLGYLNGSVIGYFGV